MLDKKEIARLEKENGVVTFPAFVANEYNDAHFNISIRYKQFEQKLHSSLNSKLRAEILFFPVIHGNLRKTNTSFRNPVPSKEG